MLDIVLCFVLLVFTGWLGLGWLWLQALVEKEEGGYCLFFFGMKKCGHSYPSCIY